MLLKVSEAWTEDRRVGVGELGVTGRGGDGVARVEDRDEVASVGISWVGEERLAGGVFFVALPSGEGFLVRLRGEFLSDELVDPVVVWFERGSPPSCFSTAFPFSSSSTLLIAGL